MKSKYFISMISGLLFSAVFIQPAITKADGQTQLNRRDQIKQKVEDIRLKSKERVEEIKSKTEAKTNEIRSKACDSRKVSIEKRLNDRVNSAKKHKEKFDSIYSRVEEFSQSKSLSSAEVDQLKTSVDVSGQKALEEISILESMNVDIDCTNPDTVAITVDAFKSQLINVREKLKEYRDSIRAYSQAVKVLAESKDGNI